MAKIHEIVNVIGPAIGDSFALECGDTLIETTITDITDDGVVVYLDETAIKLILDQKKQDLLEGKTGPGLWDNIRKRKASGKRMRKPGEKGAPTTANFRSARAGSKNEDVAEGWMSDDEPVSWEKGGTRAPTGALGSNKLKGTPVVSLSDFGDEDTKKNKYGQTVPKKLSKDDPRVKFHKEGVTEGFDKEAGAWRDWQLDHLDRQMEMLSRLVKGWKPSKKDHLEAIEAGYDAMKETGDVKDAAKAIFDTFKEIQRRQGVAESYKEPTDAAGHAKMAAKIKKMLDDTLADRGDRHGNPDPQRLTRAYEYHMEKAKEKSQGVAEGQDWSPGAKETINKDKIQSLKNLIAIYKEKGNHAKVKELQAELSNLQSVEEAKYQGREVPLGKPMKGDVKKSKVYVKNAKGNVVKVNFGDPNMRIKKSSPKHRKSFRARHHCDTNPGPRWKARYWSCRAW